MNELTVLGKMNALDVFRSETTIEELIDKVRREATDFEPDISTPAGRKKIAAQAYKVSQFKIAIDKAGKELTDDWFRRKKIVDTGRRFARETLDNLRDEIRRPLTEWEEEQERIRQEAAIQAEIEADEIEAYGMNDLFDREAKLQEAEARLERERLEREEKERQEQEEKARLEREERLRQEAAEKATKEAEEKLKREKEAREKAEREKKAAEEKAERDRIAATEKAERDRKAAVAAAEKKARDEAEQKERDRIRREEDEKREAQQRAADRENRRKINRAAVQALVEGGVSKTAATKAVTLIASGKIPSVSIRY